MIVYKSKYGDLPSYYFYIDNFDEVFNVSRASIGSTQKNHFDERYIPRKDEYEIVKINFKEVPKEYLPKVIRYIFDSWRQF